MNNQQNKLPFGNTNFNNNNINNNVNNNNNNNSNNMNNNSNKKNLMTAINNNDSDNIYANYQTNNDNNTQQANNTNQNNMYTNYQPQNNNLNITKIEKNEKISIPSSTILKIIYGLLVIVVIIIIISYVNKSNNSYNNKNNNEFVNNANAFIKLAKNDVKKNNVPNCSNKQSTKLNLSKIINGELSSISPYGNSYDLESSYVKVDATNNTGECIYTYSIYITDNKYSLGTPDNPLLEKDINVNNIKSIK